MTLNALHNQTACSILEHKHYIERLHQIIFNTVQHISSCRISVSSSIAGGGSSSSSNSISNGNSGLVSSRNIHVWSTTSSNNN